MSEKKNFQETSECFPVTAVPSIFALPRFHSVIYERWSNGLEKQSYIEKRLEEGL